MSSGGVYAAGTRRDDCTVAVYLVSVYDIITGGADVHKQLRSVVLVGRVVRHGGQAMRSMIVVTREIERTILCLRNVDTVSIEVLEGVPIRMVQANRKNRSSRV